MTNQSEAKRQLSPVPAKNPNAELANSPVIKALVTATGSFVKGELKERDKRIAILESRLEKISEILEHRTAALWSLVTKAALPEAPRPWPTETTITERDASGRARTMETRPLDDGGSL